MRTVGWVIVVVVGIVLLLVIAILAGQVGGIAIRKQGAQPDPLQLIVSEPVLRGVPVVVRWNVEAADDTTSEAAAFFWRDATAEYRLGETQLSDRTITIEFPCVAETGSGTLVVRSTVSEKVVGTRPVELAPAGPECI